MGEVLMTGSGGSGVTSEDVTATRDKLLQGCTALTADSNDEVVEGMVKVISTERNNYSVNLSNEFGIDTVRGHLYIHLPHRSGYYTRNDNIPHVCMDSNNLGNATADKVLRGTRATSKHGMNFEGTIPVVDTAGNDYKANHQAHAFGLDHARGYMWINLPHLSAYYTRHDNHPHVTIPIEALGEATGDTVLSGVTATSRHGLKFTGTMPRWRCNTGDVMTAYNNEGYAWDDVYAGRGRGLVVRIPNGFKIENANWVFLSSPNLQPWNIRAGVNVNGVTGTMPDYGAGGVAFNGATFDGRLLLSVAKNLSGGRIKTSMRLRNMYSVSGSGITSNYMTFHDSGWYDSFPRIRLQLVYDVPSYRRMRNDTIPFNNSVNLTPFSRITATVSVSSEKTKSDYGWYTYAAGLIVAEKDGVLSWKNSMNGSIEVNSYATRYEYVTSDRPNINNHVLNLSLDVSPLQGHFMLAIQLFMSSDRDTQETAANFVINNITFHN